MNNRIEKDPTNNAIIFPQTYIQGMLEQISGMEVDNIGMEISLHEEYSLRYTIGGDSSVTYTMNKESSTPNLMIVENVSNEATSYGILVPIHGTASDGLTMLPLALVAAEKYGQVQIPTIAQEISYEEQVARVSTLILALQSRHPNQTLTLMGHSMGATLIMDALSNVSLKPDSLKLIFVAPYYPDGIALTLRGLRQIMKAAIDKRYRVGPMDIARVIVDSDYYSDISPPNRRIGDITRRLFAEALSRRDHAPLEASHQPTLERYIPHGTSITVVQLPNDRIILERAINRFMQTLKKEGLNPRHIQVGGTSHMAITDPTVVRQIFEQIDRN